MKKQLILLFVAGLFSLTSCSSDDDDASPESYSVVGTWNLTAMSPSITNLDDCPEKPTIVFNEDGSAQWTYYDTQNNCAVVNDGGDWTKDSETEYTIFVPQFGALTGTVAFSSATAFTFSGTKDGVSFVLTFEQ